MEATRTGLVSGEREVGTAPTNAETSAPARCASRIATSIESAGCRTEYTHNLLTVRRQEQRGVRQLAASALLLVMGVALAVSWVVAVERQHAGIAERAIQRNATARPIAAGWFTVADEAEIARLAR